MHMKTKVLFAARVVLVLALALGLAACTEKPDSKSKQKAEQKSEAASEKYAQAMAAYEWAACGVLLAERGKNTPNYGADYFRPAELGDVGKKMLTTVGPAGASKEIMAKFKASLRSEDRKEAGRIIDAGQVFWLKSGQEVELLELGLDGIAAIRPPGAAAPVYVLDWSIKRAK
jgi:hypothetical protein